MFVIVWEFVVKPGQEAAFERDYSPDGDWSRLFRRCDGYVGTELLRDTEEPRRYVTLDRWLTPDQYVRAMAAIAPDYQALDERCASHATTERQLGNFVIQ